MKRQKAAERTSPKKLEEKEKVSAKGRVDITGKRKTGITRAVAAAQKQGSKEQAGPTSGTTRTGGVSPLRRTLLLNAKSQRSIGAGQQENIFSSFHSDHERTTEAVLTELERHPRCYYYIYYYIYYYHSATKNLLNSVFDTVPHIMLLYSQQAGSGESHVDVGIDGLMNTKSL